MQLDRASFRALTVALLAVLTGGLATAQPSQPPQPPKPPITVRPVPLSAVILELTQNGGELTPAQREAVETAILAMARSADVVLCRDGLPSIADSALEALCARPDGDLPRLWWKALIVTSRVNEIDFLRLNLELKAGKAPTGPAQLVVLSSTPLPPAEGKKTDLLLAEELEATLADLPDVGGWFGTLQQRPDLVRPWPSRETASSNPSSKPPTVVKAEKAPEIRRRIEVRGSKNTSPRAPAATVFFLVREALVGGGFSRGVTGNLRVSVTGLGFTPKGKSREQWSISWRDLKEVSKDAGDWDVSHPLVIADQKDRKRFITRIDAKGTSLPADAILTAIQQKRSAKTVKSNEEATELK